MKRPQQKRITDKEKRSKLNTQKIWCNEEKKDTTEIKLNNKINDEWTEWYMTKDSRQNNETSRDMMQCNVNDMIMIWNEMKFK